MGKKEFASLVKEQMEWDYSDAETLEFVESFLFVLQREVANGNHVTFQNFGRFDRSHRQARKYHLRKRTIEIPAHDVFSFLSDDRLDAAMNVAVEEEGESTIIEGHEI